jgi:hypothetical protein
VFPRIVLAAVAVPLLVAAFAVSRRRTEDAEAYQERWREEEQRTHPPEPLY